MIVKSNSVENKIEIINKNKMHLFYGENLGLIHDIKSKIRIMSKEIDFISLLQDEVLKNPSILFSEIRNKSLFQKKKIIIIDQVSDKIFDIVSSIKKEIQDEKVYLFGSLLDKKSKLRNYFENSTDYGITPCYKDDATAIKKIIMDKLKSFEGLNIEIINLLIRNTRLNREKLNNEISKVHSYFYRKKLDYGKLSQLLNDETNEDFNLLKDMALKGDKNKTNKLLTDTIFEKDKDVYYLNLINQRINKLKEINELKTRGLNTETALNKTKPPIFWKDKPILIEQLYKWNNEKITNALDQTYNTEIQIKSNTMINKDLLIKDLLVKLCVAASSS